MYKTGGLPVYDTTLSWYLQIQSQFHYQTKTQDNICHWLWQASNIRLCRNIQCLMANRPCFLIKSNFITSLFDGTTAAFCIKFRNKHFLLKGTGTEQMVHIDRTEHCHWTRSLVYGIFHTHFSLSDKMDSSTVTDTTQLSEIPKSMGFLFLLEIFKQKQTCPVCLYIMSIQPQHYMIWDGYSIRGLAVLKHTFDQNWVARPLPFLE